MSSILSEFGGIPPVCGAVWQDGTTTSPDLWESQQVLVGEAANIAREAGRQLGNFGREQVVPGVKDGYGRYAAPYVDKSKQFSKQVLSDRVVPTAGAVVGSALSVWDAANDTRSRLASGKGFVLPDAATYAK